MAVSKRVRYEVLRRDNHACRYCGGVAPDVSLVVDHVMPVALGGSDDPSNLVSACRDCNSGKTSTSPDGPLVAEVDEKAAQWAEAMKIVAEGRAAERAERERIEERLYDVWESNRPNRWRSTDMPGNWVTSILTFIQAGLDLEDIEDLMLTALSTRTASDKWRYFCGCCWTRIRKAQEQAAEIVSEWDRDSEVSAAEYEWATIALHWNERTGTRLRACMCTEPCGQELCVISMAKLAEGALVGIEQIKDLFTKQEGGSEPSVEEESDGA